PAHPRRPRPRARRRVPDGARARGGARRRRRPRRVRLSQRRRCAPRRAGRVGAAVVDGGAPARRARGDGPRQTRRGHACRRDTGARDRRRDRAARPASRSEGASRCAPTAAGRRGALAAARRSRPAPRRGAVLARCHEPACAPDLRRGRRVTLVTAAITTYNRAPFLDGALESVYAQTFDDYEVLVVDDGSTDDTREVLSRHRDRARIVRQENLGRSSARNTAVREARGRYVSFLDSDDRWLPDKLAREAPVLESDDRIGMVHGHVEVIGEDDITLTGETARHRELLAAAHRKAVTYAGYAFDCRCFSSALTARVEAIRGVGMYDPALL